MMKALFVSFPRALNRERRKVDTEIFNMVDSHNFPSLSRKIDTKTF